jgi:DNA-binding transcriptional LysR family regulator
MYAITTADEKSINKTAQRFFVSQPAISDAIRDLEDEIGITIFERSNRGVTTTTEGADFIVYARQVVAQYDLLKERYIDKEQKKRFGVSAQHYTFAVKSYIELIENHDPEKYEFSIYEGKTSEVINDVRTFKSEIGIIHLDEYNHNFLLKYLRVNNLEYQKLFDCKVFVYLSTEHPLADKKRLTCHDLEPYPCLTFNQGEENPIYLAEEPVSMFERRKIIKVNDRGTMLNMMISRFDDRAKNEGIEKIKTIGDAYMAACGLTEEAENGGAAKMVRFAQGLIEDVNAFNKEYKVNVQIRLGINTGNLVAGVIGKTKFIYDIWGDTVNVASRMESTGEPMKIHVSEETYEQTKEKFVYGNSIDIEVKGKGLMKTYFL